jgi:hypothetical protein
MPRARLISLIKMICVVIVKAGSDEKEDNTICNHSANIHCFGYNMLVDLQL